MSVSSVGGGLDGSRVPSFWGAAVSSDGGCEPHLTPSILVVLVDSSPGCCISACSRVLLSCSMIRMVLKNALPSLQGAGQTSPLVCGESRVVPCPRLCGRVLRPIRDRPKNLF